MVKIVIKIVAKIVAKIVVKIVVTISLWYPTAAIVTTQSLMFSASRRLGMAVISLDFPPFLTWPRGPLPAALLQIFYNLYATSNGGRRRAPEPSQTQAHAVRARRPQRNQFPAFSRAITRTL